MRTRYRDAVPTNLTECIAALKKQLSDENLEEIGGTPLDEFRDLAHFGIGLWIRNNFLHSPASPLAKYFKERGVFEADDMSSLILTALHKDITTGAFGEDELFSLFVSHGG